MPLPKSSAFSNTDFDQKLLRIFHKRLSESDTEEIFNEDADLENSSKEDNEDKETVKAYRMYITEVMSTFVFNSNPSVNLELILPKIKESAGMVIKVAKDVLEVK